MGLLLLLVNIQLDLLTFSTPSDSTCRLHSRDNIFSTCYLHEIITFSLRTTKYLKKASLTRTCAIGGFFLSIPLFLIGKC